MNRAISGSSRSRGRRSSPVLPASAALRLRSPPPAGSCPPLWSNPPLSLRSNPRPPLPLNPPLQQPQSPSCPSERCVSSSLPARCVSAPVSTAPARRCGRTSCRPAQRWSPVPAVPPGAKSRSSIASRSPEPAPPRCRRGSRPVVPSACRCRASRRRSRSRPVRWPAARCRASGCCGAWSRASRRFRSPSCRPRTPGRRSWRRRFA